ncbi:MAG: hypothetical protein GX621_10035, partial [Pirellulaceae bacterium]|nr:hypothetical protein [Pirellulaceae bacterium]
LLAAADHLDAIKDIIKRKAGQDATGGSLADATAFQKIMARCQKHAGEAVPQIRWFVDPIGYAECVRIMTPEDKRRKGVVITDVFRNQGFDAIQGIGGYIDFKVDQYELLHRTAVYAPGPYAKAPEPYVNKVGMEILTFPNTSDYSLPPFIPNDVATCTMFHWDLLKVFDNIGPTFNELFADKGDTTMFDDLIRDFEEDEFGPQINLREELVKHFDHRVTIISDYILPITTKSERLLFAVKVRDAEKVAAGIKKLLKDDPTIERREFEGLEIWETIEQDEMHLPSAPVIDLPDLAPEKKATPSKRERRLAGDEEDEELLLPHAAVTVVHGHLLVASHYDYLVEILTRAKQPEPLAESMDFRTVASAMDALGAGGDFLRAFSRTDEEYRPTYELIRQGKMPEAETMFARMLNSLFGPHKPGVVREQKVDGKEMPDYQIVRRYLGPAGTFGRTEEDGWFVVGFMLKK